MTNIFSLDFTEMFEHMIGVYEDISGYTIERQDAERLMFQIFSEEIYYWGSGWVSASQQNFLSGMTDDQIDEYGEFTDTERLASTPASFVVRFEFYEPLVTALILYENTTVPGTNENGTYTFKITEDTYVDAGLDHYDIEMFEFIDSTTNSGASANNIEIGNITALDTDSEALYENNIIETVSNITESSGGVDSESDENYIERLRLAPSKFSTGGAYDAYRYWARRASANIADVGLVKVGWNINLYILPQNYDGAYDIELIGDENSQLDNLSLTGLTIDEPQFGTTGNTDNGVLYWNLTDTGGTRTFSIYSDSAKTTLVAQYTGSDGLGVTVAEQGGSGLSGTVDLAYTADDTDSSNRINSAMQSVGAVQLVMYPETGYSKIRPLNDIVKSNLISDVSFTISGIDIVIDTNNIETVKNKTLQAVDIFIVSLKNKAGKDVVRSQLEGIISSIEGVKQVVVELNSSSGIAKISIANSEVAFGSFSSSNLTITVEL